MRSLALVVGLFVLFPVYAVAEQVSVATWNTQYLSDFGERKYQPEDYAQLRQIAERLEAGTRPRCWAGYYQEFIDHIFVGSKTAQWLSSFQEVVFREATTKEGRAVWEERISDHYPLRETFTIEE